MALTLFVRVGPDHKVGGVIRYFFKYFFRHCTVKSSQYLQSINSKLFHLSLNSAFSTGIFEFPLRSFLWGCVLVVRGGLGNFFGNRNILSN